mmetsp:Transcript_41653/g.61134  ORF Transcript_41653/g.61134 Transcript_41653/m.61134 type:complete len:289 (+) Transcript_41653:358-1224(+)
MRSQYCFSSSPCTRTAPIFAPSTSTEPAAHFSTNSAWSSADLKRARPVVGASSPSFAASSSKYASLPCSFRLSLRAMRSPPTGRFDTRTMRFGISSRFSSSFFACSCAFAFAAAAAAFFSAAFTLMNSARDVTASFSPSLNSTPAPPSAAAAMAFSADPSLANSTKQVPSNLRVRSRRRRTNATGPNCLNKSRTFSHTVSDGKVLTKIVRALESSTSGNGLARLTPRPSSPTTTASEPLSASTTAAASVVRALRRLNFSSSDTGTNPSLAASATLRKCLSRRQLLSLK